MNDKQTEQTALQYEKEATKVQCAEIKAENCNLKMEISKLDAMRKYYRKELSKYKKESAEEGI